MSSIMIDCTRRSEMKGGHRQPKSQRVYLAGGQVRSGTKSPLIGTTPAQRTAAIQNWNLPRMRAWSPDATSSVQTQK